MKDNVLNFPISKVPDKLLDGLKSVVDFYLDCRKFKPNLDDINKLFEWWIEELLPQRLLLSLSAKERLLVVDASWYFFTEGSENEIVAYKTVKATLPFLKKRLAKLGVDCYDGKLLYADTKDFVYEPLMVIRVEDLLKVAIETKEKEIA